MKKIVALLLATVLFCLTGCQVVGDIAGNVAEAASEELKKQVQQALQEHKVEVVELKTAVGKLNDESDAKLQFFCAVLLKTNSQDSLNACVGTLGSLFPESGSVVQTQSKVESDHLVHKGITYDFTGFSEDQVYYTVYAYVPDISIKLPDLESMIPSSGPQS
jgi:hypothetical protein